MPPEIALVYSSTRLEPPVHALSGRTAEATKPNPSDVPMFDAFEHRNAVLRAARDIETRTHLLVKERTF